MDTIIRFSHYFDSTRWKKYHECAAKCCCLPAEPHNSVTDTDFHSDPASDIMCICLCVCLCVLSLQSRERHSSLIFSMEAVSCTWPLRACAYVFVCACMCELPSVWAACLYKCSVKTTCWWLALYLGFQLHAASYQLNLSSFLFQISTHAHEQTYSPVCVCVCICVCVCVCGSVSARMCSCRPSRIYCCSPPWPKVNGWRISLVFSPSIVWGSSGSVLDAERSTMQDALNHSETPHYNISIVYLFSLCLPHRLVGGKREIQRSSRFVCTRFKLLERLSPLFHQSLEYHLSALNSTFFGVFF